ncbi:MAG: hypothetical protein N2249_02325 [Melioribacter sp.]|nr:hypothetical protein [Melioribacter sp.]
MKKNFYFYLFFLMILLGHCTKSEDSKTDFKKLSLDKSKLDNLINSEQLGIKFYQPKNWQMINAELSQKNEKLRNNQIEKNFIFKPLYLFFNDSSKSLLNVGLVELKDSLLTFNEKLNIYKNFLSKKYISNNLEITNFENSTISFTQFKYEIGGYVNYRIVFNSKKTIVQFDFTILKDKVTEERKFIESVLASIELMN